jgi:hypothetical protein
MTIATKNRRLRRKPTEREERDIGAITKMQWHVYHHGWDRNRMTTRVVSTMPDPLTAMAHCQYLQLMNQAVRLPPGSRKLTVWCSTDVSEVARDIAFNWPERVFDPARSGWTDSAGGGRIPCSDFADLVQSMLDVGHIEDVGQKPATTRSKSQAKPRAK